MTPCRPKDKPRRARADEREGPMTCVALGKRFASFLCRSLDHRQLKAASRHRPIARARRGLAFGLRRQGGNR
jgi:hypothetical protein